MTVTGQHISLLIAEKILRVFEESGASEAEKYAALDVVRSLVPVLPNASCSVEAKFGSIAYFERVARVSSLLAICSRIRLILANSATRATA